MITKFSQTGASHEKNQDVVRGQNLKKMAIITLADGASTCKRASDSASFVSEKVTELFGKKYKQLLQFDNQEISDFLVRYLQDELETLAKSQQENLMDYSTTIAIVVIDKEKNRLFYLSIGNSLILATELDRISYLSYPRIEEKGTYMITTEHVEKKVISGMIENCRFDSIAIFSDGAWKTMFSGNGCKPEILENLVSQDYSSIQTYLEECDPSDDASFITFEF